MENKGCVNPCCIVVQVSMIGNIFPKNLGAVKGRVEILRDHSVSGKKKR